MNQGHLEFCTSDDWRAVLEAQILPRALDGVELGHRVVEVGPGPGFTTEALLRSADHVTAVELDPELARRLRARLGGARVDVVVGDARATGLPADAFSGAASFHMLHHVPTGAEQDEVFAELARLLGPSGTLLLADGFDSDAVREFHEGDLYCPIDPASLGDRLGAAGFEGVDVETYELGWVCRATLTAAS